jgi:hypothetical protein
MYYEINVSKKITKNDGFIQSEIGKYHHLFATAPRSITSEKELIKVYKVFKKKFPEPEFEMMIHRDDQIQHSVDIDDVINRYMMNR